MSALSGHWLPITGHLPSAPHSEQPIKLHPAPQPTFQHSIRPAQDTMQSTKAPSIPSHEGCLLRLADDDPFAVPANTHPSDSFQLDLENALSGAGLLAHGDSNFGHHATAALPGHSTRSDFTQTADLEQHELAMDEAISRQAASKPHSTPAQTAAEATKSASTEADSQLEGKDTAPQHAGSSTGVGYTDGEDMLGMVGLSATPASTADASHTNNHPLTGPKHVANHVHHLHHASASNHTSSPPAHPTCSIHKNLPIPGTDVAPADKDRCYPHPQIYMNNNYLNDSFYMLYHHDDIPTTHPHPAFTWGDIGRFARVSHRMRRKEPVTVTFVGGSVSSSYCQDPAVTCWVDPVAAWLKEHNPAVQIINNAVGGTTSRTTAECFDAMVGKDADLIFLEYSYNDRCVLCMASCMQCLCLSTVCHIFICLAGAYLQLLLQHALSGTVLPLPSCPLPLPLQVIL